MHGKIAIIIERADITLGGAERSVIELADALSQTGLEVDVLAATGRSNSEHVHVLCGAAPSGRTSFSTFADALKKHLSQNQYSLVHSTLPFDFADVYQPRGGAYAESILRNADSYQNKFLTSYKKLTAFANLRRTILLRAERALCRTPDGPTIVALSEYVARQFEQHYAADSQRIVVIPNGVKTDKPVDTQEADKLRNRIFSKLGLKNSDNPVLFLFAANNFRLKGLNPLIKAMHLAITQLNTKRTAYLVVAGKDRTEKYRRIAKKLDPLLDRKIIFLGPVGQIQNLLSIINVAVLPTFYDPASRFVLEAIAAGKPVITTRFNGATDLFVHNRHGKILDAPDDIPALAEAIAYFTDTENIKKAAQAIDADNLREKVSISRTAEQLSPLYESILQTKGKK